MSKTRSIFEEVSADKPVVETPKGGHIDTGRNEWRKPASIWMMILFAMVACMILVGGLTRLTDSGLSITEWKPVTGSVPPLNAADWDAEFTKYKATPEYQLVNKDMELGAFKTIYWWEWGHRQLGRMVGLVWAIGVLYFLIRYSVPKGWRGRMLFVGVLGGLQGAIGWWMVSSGLTGRMVDVASYRLATHLGLAFIILSFLAWYIWGLRRDEMELFQARRNNDARVARLLNILLPLVFLQILLGALVAGIDAGRGYTDWPLMGGQFLPSESFDYTPFWTNLFENPALVQWNHRMLGYAVLVFTVFAWFRSRASAINEVRSGMTLVLAGVLFQMFLGIITVMNAAPWHLAIFHQLGAIFVIIFVLRARFASMFPKTQSLRA